ncbi:hypothetical protein [endosymbiont of Ridgeia piscesae]|jgi:hypothetical protein|uniref:Glycosyl transferase family 1 n=1 Tax=endosymbiont of Ridgeia piscesae TaxID=54398 RepID=A0A0T5Z0X3_9GAMM|nr:hypothetical protein [endosymbiont of Ridgeia piscesae]KRT56464.1 Glycosyl transferase family 1 [endosymbiont of Ridgeia piscesae]KRT59325.1 Glycosyl transferase family 1 [endosymbiont of Ridgeia piscesae]
MAHLLAAISGHGFGHAAQTSVLVNALRQRLPRLRLTLATDLPEPFLRRRFAGHFELLRIACDPGMPMHSALQVDVDAAHYAYREYHRDWQSHLQSWRALLCSQRPDLVFADAPYMVLSAARLEGLPCAAGCSLNWADIYGHFCGSKPGGQTIRGQIEESYQQADAFFRFTPSMPMPWLENGVDVGPLVAPHASVRRQLFKACDLSDQTRLVLVSLGGLDTRIDFQHWPEREGIRWILPQSWQVRRRDVLVWEALEQRFGSVLGNCDAVILKPGYGMISEAVINRLPVLCTLRGDWPEQPYLLQWLRRHGRVLDIEPQALLRGAIGDTLERLWQLPKAAPVAATGIGELLPWFESRLG